MSRNVLVRVLSTDDGCGENGVGRSEARSNRQGRQEVEARNERVYEGSGNEPSL